MYCLVYVPKEYERHNHVTMRIGFGLKVVLERGSFYPDWMKLSSTLGILPRLDDSLPRPDEFDPNWMKVYPDWVSAKTPKKGYFL